MKREIDAEIERIMWLEIDETVSPGEREKLRAHLEKNPSAREHFDALRRMALLFGRTDEIDPPSELRGRILQALQRATPPEAVRAGLFDRIGAFFSPRPAWRLAAAAAAGILMGIAAYHFVSRDRGASGSGDESVFYGTMSVNGGAKQGEVLRIDAPGVTGTLELRGEGSRVLAQISVSSQEDIEIVIEYPGAPQRVDMDEIPEHPRNQVSVEKGEVRVRHQGSGVYRLVFALDDESESPVRTRVFSEGRLVFEGEALPPRQGASR